MRRLSVLTGSLIIGALGMLQAPSLPEPLDVGALRASLEKAVKINGNIGATTSLAYNLIEAAKVAGVLGDNTLAKTALLRAIDLGRKDEPGYRAIILTKAVRELAGFDPKTAASVVDEAVEALKQVKEEDSRNELWVTVIPVYAAVGQIDKALAAAKEVKDEYERANVTRDVIIAVSVQDWSRGEALRQKMDADAQAGILKGMIVSLAGRDLNRALQEVGKIKGEDERREALLAVALRIACVDPARAVEVVRGFGDSVPPDDFLWKGLLSAVARTDLKLAITMVNEIKEPLAQSEVCVQLCQTVLGLSH